MIDVLRDDLARKVGARWKDIFKLTLSFADGSSARISAINAALKPYRPNYMHFWQLKTFWNETKVDQYRINFILKSQVTRLFHFN